MSDQEANPAEISEAALLKSLERIEAIAKGSPEAKQRDLLQKSLEGKASPAETAELVALLKGERPGVEPAGAALAAAVAGSASGALQKSIDVSEALTELVAGIQTALRGVGDRLDKGATSATETSLVLAEGLLRVGQLVKAQSAEIQALQKAIDEFGRQPAHGGRATTQVPQAQANRLGGGATGRAGGIQGPEIMQVMNRMLEESMAKGHEGKAPCGEDLTKAVAKLETVGEVSRPLMRDLANYRKSLLEKAKNGESVWPS